MITETLLTEDKLVDMLFITTLTGLTDKWFYKLIKDGEFPKPIKLGEVLAGYRVKLKIGYENELKHREAEMKLRPCPQSDCMFIS